MQDNKKILKIIIPVVAVVVIIESLVLVNDLKAKKVAINQKNNPVELREESVIDLNFMSETSSMMLGEKYKVELMMSPKSEKMIDSISSYIKYDKDAFEVSELTYDERLPAATFSKISSDKGLIVGTFMITDPNGMRIEPGNNLIVSRFYVTPKLVGEYSFEVDTGNLTKESVTMFIENASNKVLPFDSSKLNVIVSTQ